MMGKLVIVHRGDELLFRTLSKVLRDEPGVEIIYDRRERDQPGRPATERRFRWDVEERLRTEGFAVVLLSSDEPSGGNIRCSC